MIRITIIFEMQRFQEDSRTMRFSYGNGNIERNTSHWRHTLIFLFQSCYTFPWQIVPFMNQQRCADLNFHAEQFCLISSGHFRTAQQGLVLLLGNSIEANKNNA